MIQSRKKSCYISQARGNRIIKRRHNYYSNKLRKERVNVPTITGYTVNDAEKILEQLGLKLKVIRREYSDYQERRYNY